jgi:hypothetical protein
MNINKQPVFFSSRVLYLSALSLFFAAVLVLTGCRSPATPPAKLKATYIPVEQYQNYSSQQLVDELSLDSDRFSELYDKLYKRASDDKYRVIFNTALLPVLPIKGNTAEAKEFSLLRGKYDALLKSLRSRGCDTHNLPPSPDKIIESKQRAAAKEAQELINARQSKSRSRL